MLNVHLVMGVTVLVTNLVSRRLGRLVLVRAPTLGRLLVCCGSRRSPWSSRSPSARRCCSTGAVPDSLHYLYGLLPIVVTLLAEGARAVATEHEVEGLGFESLPKERQRAVAVAITRRETGIMAVSALVIFGLALRALRHEPAGLRASRLLGDVSPANGE